MRYSINLAYGVARAILWSGGWYWRAPLLPALAAPFREEAQAMLDLIGQPLPETQLLYLIAASALAAILAIRIAYLETPKAIPTSASIQKIRNDFYIRVDIKNLSLSDLDGMMCQMISIKPIIDIHAADHIDSRLVLTTQNRLRYWILQGNGALPQKRWHLDAAAKQIEVAQINTVDNRITIYHESGQEIMARVSTVFELMLSGMHAGGPVTFWVWCVCDGIDEEPVILLAKDKFDYLALQQFPVHELV
jgi:hypothetical protein